MYKPKEKKKQKTDALQVDNNLGYITIIIPTGE